MIRTRDVEGFGPFVRIEAMSMVGERKEEGRGIHSRREWTLWKTAWPLHLFS